MSNTNAPEPTRTQPEVAKDRSEDTRDPKPPLALDAEAMEDRIAPVYV